MHTVAQAFAGRALALRRAESVGGAAAGVALLPECVDLAPERAVNETFFGVRAAISGALAGQPDPPAAADDLAAEIDAMLRARDVARNLAAASSGFRERYAAALELELAARPPPARRRRRARALEELRRLLLAERLPTVARDELVATLRRLPERGERSPGVLLWGGALRGSEASAAAEARAELAESELRSTLGVAAEASEREAPARDFVRRIALPEDEAKQDMPQHAFEKVMFAEKFTGGVRRLDGADDLAEHGDSLDAVDLRELVRGGPEAHSVYHAELGDGEGVPDVAHVLPGEHALPYDEWDARARRYRRDWVRVYPTRFRPADAAAGAVLGRATAASARAMLRRLERVRHRRRALDRQTEGDEPDLTGIVEDLVRRAAGEPETGRVYLHRPRLDRDQATVLLLDLSLSADSWVKGRRVLDAAREAACVTGEAAHSLGDAFLVLAFASNTRHLCRAWMVKDWEEDWIQGRARLAALEPQGYTRIGPALRHSAALLARRPERRRRILLLTDGKPTDYDRYEGGYGVADVRMACREAAVAGVRVRALGLDPRAATQLPGMFGVGHWRAPSGLRELTEALVEAYGEDT